MDPSPAHIVHAKSNTRKERDTAIRSYGSRRTRSFPSSKYLPEDTPLNQATPCRYSGRVPFSWEQLPGIPKKYHNFKKEPATVLKVLPLPPPLTTKTFSPDEIRMRKKIFLDGFGRDPFFSALVECSKDDRDRQESNGSHETRGVSNRFGLISHYTSCKRTCSVSESIVHLKPHSSRRSTSSYGRISHGH